MKSILPIDASKGRRHLIKGTDGRKWHLVDWRVVYDDAEPSDKMVYENYVPCDEDTNSYLLRTYGPFGSDSLPGRCVSQPRES